MKVAHLTTVDMSLRYLLLAQLEAARQAGEVIGISAPGDDVPYLEARGIRHVALTSSTRDMDVGADIRAAIDLWRILKSESPDVLHTHNPKPGVYGRIVGRLAGVPIVVNTVHGLYATPESPLPRRLAAYTLEWLASRFSDAELVQSPEDVELLRRRHIMPASKLRYLGNGVDLVRFDPRAAAASRSDVRTELGVSEGIVVVGMVGRLVAEKGVLELIEAAMQLDSRYLVVVVGPKDEEKSDAIDDETIERAKRSGVRFLGMRADIERLYGAFDIFVLPSHREGFPRTAMEAAASGLPVVATDIRGCRQVVEPGVNGFLVEVGDVDGLASAVDRIGSDPALMERMSAASVEKAKAEFDETLVVKKVMTTYRDVAASKGLAWASEATLAEGTASIRPMRSAEAKDLAQLHLRMIHTGFLSSLGTRFLKVLYSAMSEAPGTCVLVAESNDVVCGFVAGVSDTRDFYAWFLRRRLFSAIWSLIPRALRPSSLRRIWETLRYGAGEHRRAPAELLAMAVAPAAQGRGVGARLVSGLFDWAATTGIQTMRVVVGADNTAAASLYRRSGFGESREITVHGDEKSLELVWRR